MATAEDATTPAAVRSSAGATVATLASSSFSPPANSLLVALSIVSNIAAAFTAGPTITMSSSAGLTWTTAGFLAGSNGWDYLGIYYAQVGSTAPGAMTCTMTRSQTTGADMQLAVRVLTGAAAAISQSTGASQAANVTGSAACTLTPTAIGSQLYAVVAEANSPTWTVLSGTSSIDYWQDTASGTAGGVAKSSALTSALTAQTIGWSGANAGDVMAVVGKEFVPSAAAATRLRPPRTVQRAAIIRAANF